jgi:hypothetical protein
VGSTSISPHRYRQLSSHSLPTGGRPGGHGRLSRCIGGPPIPLAAAVQVHILVETPYLEENTMIAVGDKAPPFELEDQFGRKVNLAQLAGKNVMLLFYPLDFTPT